MRVKESVERARKLRSIKRTIEESGTIQLDLRSLPLINELLDKELSVMKHYKKVVIGRRNSRIEDGKDRSYWRERNEEITNSLLESVNNFLGEEN